MRWAYDAIESITKHSDDADDAVATSVELCNVTAGRSIKLSSSCSGIMAPELAARAVAHAFNKHNMKLYNDVYGTHMPAYLLCQVEPTWICECNKQCQQEALNQPDGLSPEHVFVDQLDFLQDHVKSKLDTMRAASADSVRALILGSPLKQRGYCIKHNRRCNADRCHSNNTGTPCVNFSRIGTHTGFAGDNRVFWTWARHRIDLKEP